MSLAFLLIAGVAIPQTGCGTTCNLAGGILHPESEPRVYGGVIRDVEILDTAVSGDAPNDPVIQGSDKGAAVAMAALVSLAVADPMLSLVADTLTLPVTIPLQERRISRQQASTTTIP
jgi:hypothetical protein